MGVNFKPNFGLVLVKRDEAKTTTASGLHLAESHVLPPDTGHVVAVASKREYPQVGARVLMSFAEGDHVAWSYLAGVNITIEGVEYHLLHESEILGKFLD